MIQNLLKIAVASIAILVISSQGFAQTPGAAAAPAGDQKAKSLAGPRRQLATIVFAGLGGAILGLSTLSFYGRPQDNLQNIPIGFGIGLIAGITLSTAKVISNPQELYGTKPHLEEDTIHGNAFQASAAKPATLKFDFEF